MNSYNTKITLIILLSFFLSLIYFYDDFFEIHPKAYITNQGDNTVSVVDLNALEVIKTIKVGIAPLGITILKEKTLALLVMLALMIFL